MLPLTYPEVQKPFPGGLPNNQAVVILAAGAGLVELALWGSSLWLLQFSAKLRSQVMKSSGVLLRSLI